MSRNRVLGKGLSALIPGADLRGAPVVEDPADTIKRVRLDDIGFNPDQPRKLFDDRALSELADSIGQVGVLQPVLLKVLAEKDRAVPHPEARSPEPDLVYGVVAGERRVRAARLAGLVDVPAIICSYEETEALRIALLENIQREDLGPMEEAEAYSHLMRANGATQEELASMLGKNRSTVANTLRLLSLEDPIRNLLQEGKISRGHAKALLGMPAGPGRVQLARICHSRGLSVRDCEARVQQGGARPKKKSRKMPHSAPQKDPGLRALQGRAEQVFGSPVAIERDPGNGKGSLVIRFYSDSDLVRLLNIMGVDTDL